MNYNFVDILRTSGTEQNLFQGIHMFQKTFKISPPTITT